MSLRLVNGPRRSGEIGSQCEIGSSEDFFSHLTHGFEPHSAHGFALHSARRCSVHSALLCARRCSVHSARRCARRFELHSARRRLVHSTRCFAPHSARRFLVPSTRRFARRCVGSRARRFALRCAHCSALHSSNFRLSPDRSLDGRRESKANLSEFGNFDASSGFSRLSSHFFRALFCVISSSLIFFCF